MTSERDERRYVLLKAAHAFLRKIDESVLCDALCETVYYDEADCDGYCLIDYLENELDTYNQEN